MKIFLLLSVLTLSIFASSVRHNYEELNEEVDKLSLNLRAEEKVPLYFLLSSTHKNIVAALSLDETNLFALKRVEKRTLKVLSALVKDNSNIDAIQVKKIKKLYTKIIKDAYELIKNQPTTFNEKIIYKDKIVRESSPMNVLYFALFGIIIGVLIGFFIFKKSVVKEIKEIDTEDKGSNTVRDLQKRNNDLKQTIAQLKSDSRTVTKVTKENASLIIEQKELENSYHSIEERLNEKIHTLDLEKNSLLDELHTNHDDDNNGGILYEELEKLQLQSQDIIIVLDSLVESQSRQTDPNLIQPLTQQWLEEMVVALQIWQTKLENLHRENV